MCIGSLVVATASIAAANPEEYKSIDAGTNRVWESKLEFAEAFQKQTKGASSQKVEIGLHTALLRLFELPENNFSRSVVIRFDRSTTPAAFKNQRASRDKPTFGDPKASLFSILPDRTVDLFVIYPASARGEAKVSGGSKFQRVGSAKPFQLTGITGVEGEAVLGQTVVEHFQCAQGLYYGITTVAFEPSSGGSFSADPQSFTINEADAIDEFSGLKIISIFQADAPGRLGIRSPIAGVSQSRNPAAGFVTFDAIAVIDQAASNPSLGAGLTYNFSFGARKEENLEGVYGFPLFFSVTIGINGLGSNGQVGSGRPFIAPGVTIRFRT